MRATDHRYTLWAAAPVALIVFAATLAFGLGASGVGASGVGASGTAPPGIATRETPAPIGGGSSDRPTAAEVYRSDCSFCHGSDGSGTSQGPSLGGVGEASLDFELSTGRMPLSVAGRANVSARPVSPLPRAGPFDPRRTQRHVPAYDRRTIDELTGYVTQLTGGGGPSIPEVAGGDVANGGQLYRLQCAACHSWSGVGGALLHREAPGLHRATPTQVGEAIRVGPGQMPDFGRAALDDQQLRDVVAYVGHLDESRDPGGVALGGLGPVSEGAVALVGLASLLLFIRWIGQRA